MERLIVLVVLTAVAVGIALILQRRRPDPPSAPSYRAPTQLDPDDFPVSAKAPFVVLFGSQTCESCPGAWSVVTDTVAATGAAIGTARIDVQDDTDLHRRYRIDGVPTTVIADGDGVVRQAFFGPITTDELTAAMIDA
ncbi:MAG: thioredoxin domain-containing protein, partial [Actinomycetota bacterium]